MEIWKDIIGYDGAYRISSHGRVWSKHKKGISDINPVCSGYVKVSLFKKSKVSVVRVHRLVASHFIDNPNQLPLVDHINNVRNDNHVDNLRWVDSKGNRSNSKRNTEYSNGEYITYTEEELKNEVWVDTTKIIDELKDKEYFMISSLGRYRYYKKNKKWSKPTIITKSVRQSRMYPQTSITLKNGVRYTFNIHKLVALCFLRKPNEGEVIDHIDGDICNPRLSNLQIITRSENSKKAKRRNSQGVNSGYSFHTTDDIIKVLNEFYFTTRTKRDIAKEMNMFPETVTRIVTGKTYKSIYNEFIKQNPVRPDRPTRSEILSRARKGVPQKKVTCPHCGKTGGNSLMGKHHFDRCKYKSVTE
jgi:hypothetical protein